MSAALICAALAAVLVGINGAEMNLAALALCLLGLGFASGAGERWLAKRRRN